MEQEEDLHQIKVLEQEHQELVNQVAVVVLMEDLEVMVRLMEVTQHLLVVAHMDIKEYL
jgi:hypothetical protein